MDKVVLEWSKPIAMAEIVENTGVINVEGLYMFLVGEELKGLTAYYIGQSQNIGKRVKTHYNWYTSGNYWVPKFPEDFAQDVLGYYRPEIDYKEKFFAPDSSGENKVAGKKLMDITYVSHCKPFSTSENPSLEEIESVFIAGVLKKNNLKPLGWFGDGKTLIPISSLEIQMGFPYETQEYGDWGVPRRVEYNLDIK